MVNGSSSSPSRVRSERNSRSAPSTSRTRKRSQLSSTTWPRAGVDTTAEPSTHANSFSCTDGRVLKRETLRTRTKTLIRKAGVDTGHFAGHSFRRGGATDLHHGGATAEEIKKRGRWRSACYRRYVHTERAGPTSAAG